MSLLDFVHGNNDHTLRVEYLLVGIVLFLICANASPTLREIRAGHVVAFGLAIFACYYLFAFNNQQRNTASDEANAKLADLDPNGRYRFLYLDLNLVDVLHAAISLRSLNGAVFNDMLASTNEVLKREALLLYDVDALHSASDVADVAQNFQIEGVASFHALVYALPPNRRAYYTLYQSCLDDYRVMLMNHVQRLYMIANAQIEERTIDVSTPPVKKMHKPRPLTCRSFWTPPGPWLQRQALVS